MPPQYSHGTKSANPEFSKRVVDDATEVITDYVDLTKLPEFGILSKQVNIFKVLVIDITYEKDEMH